MPRFKMKRRRDTEDTADSRKSGTEYSEEMVFNWTDEMVLTLLHEISQLRTQEGVYRNLPASGFNKKGACWNELYVSLGTYDEFRGLTKKEMIDKIIKLENVAKRVVNLRGEPPAEDDVPLHRAMYKAFQAGLLPPPGMLNAPSSIPAFPRNVRPRLVQCCTVATSASASTSATNATIPSCTVADFNSVLSPYKDALTPQQFARVYNYGSKERIVEHSRRVCAEEFLNFLIETANILEDQRHYQEEE